MQTRYLHINGNVNVSITLDEDDVYNHIEYCDDCQNQSDAITHLSLDTLNEGKADINDWNFTLYGRT